MSIPRFPVRLKTQTFSLYVSRPYPISISSFRPLQSQLASSRHLHSTRSHPSTVSIPDVHSSPTQPTSPPNPDKKIAVLSSTRYPLSCLPLPVLLRNLIILTLSSSPLLLTPSLHLLSTIAYTSSPLLSPSRNPLLRLILKKTIFKQFCAGENPAEVKETLQGLRGWGIQGVMLGWAREVEQRGEEEDGGVEKVVAGSEETERDRKEIGEWVKGTMQALELAEKRDCVCVKFTGAGSLNLLNLASSLPPSPSLVLGLEEICTIARSRDITFVIDAEQAALQPGVESWTLSLSRQYNTTRAFVVGTYQAYLKATPERLALDLETASREGWVLGIKLVRGAYLGSDPRGLMWGTKEETDACYDGLAEGVMRRRWGGPWLEHPGRPTAPTPESVTPIATGRPTLGGEKTTETAPSAGGPPRFPNVCLILATHNTISSRKAMAVRADQARRGESRVPLVYAQLMGMADHVSCELVAESKAAFTLPETAVASVDTTGKLAEADDHRDHFTSPTPVQHGSTGVCTMDSSIGSGSSGTCTLGAGIAEEESSVGEPVDVERPRPYKYLVWGTVDECLKYLVRRAEENRDAVARTEEGRKLLWKELGRRVWGGRE